MKKSIISFVSLVMVALFFTSCENTADDFMTSNVKTGGLVSALKTFPYKVGATKTFEVPISIPKGPGIKSIEVYKTYTGKSKVLDQTIDVASANASGNVTKTISYTYATLSKGLEMPSDETTLTIGDKWTLTYVSIMEDGRKVDSSSKTSISIANFFAGTYSVEMKYFHPTAGGSYPTTPYSSYTKDIDMSALSAAECQVWFGVWEDNKITIRINSDNRVALAFERTDATMGDPNNSAKISKYDPSTGKIELYYSYPGSGGYRIFWAVYTPK